MANRLRATHVRVAPSASDLRGDDLDRAAQVFGVLLGAAPDTAQAILKRLGSEEQRRLAQALVRGQQPTDEAVNDTLRAFVVQFQETPLSAEGAAPHRRGNNLGRTAGPDAGRQMILRALNQRGTKLPPDDPFLTTLKQGDQLERIRSLCAALDPKMLVSFVERESVAVGGMILALAAPATAVAILKQIRTEHSAALLLSLASKDDVAPEALDALVSSLEEMLEQSASRITLHQGQSPSERVAHLLRGLDAEKRESILESLGSLGGAGDRAASMPPGELARDVRKQLLSVAQLARLLPKDLGLVLGPITEGDVARALLLQPQEIREAYFGALSTRRAACVREEIEQLEARRGHIRKKDLETAADAIVARAQGLRHEGRIMFPWDESLV